MVLDASLQNFPLFRLYNNESNLIYDKICFVLKVRFCKIRNLRKVMSALVAVHQSPRTLGSGRVALYGIQLKGIVGKGCIPVKVGGLNGGEGG